MVLGVCCVCPSHVDVFKDIPKVSASSQPVGLGHNVGASGVGKHLLRKVPAGV